jgi:N-acetyl-anhydromuramyl-L-alanine amidase AmpD
MGLSKHSHVTFDGFYEESQSKNQVYLHHTAGGPNGEDVFKFWSNDAVRVATCVCISRDGTIVQGFHSQYWAFHLGLTNSVFALKKLPYKALDKSSIGIEICNYGSLTLKNGKYYNWAGGVVKDVCTLDKPFRGSLYYENYTDEQIQSVKELLLLWKDRYGIDIKYREDIWDICDRALKGENGVFTHCSVRHDKSDIYPHPKMIAMLKSL